MYIDLTERYEKSKQHYLEYNSHPHWSYIMFHNLPSNEPSPNLICSRSNVIQLRVSKVPLHFVFLSVSIASKGLNGIGSHFIGSQRGIEQDSCTVSIGDVLGLVDCLGQGVHIGTTWLKFNKHIRKFALHQLEISDFLFELFPCLDIGNAVVHAALHESDRTSG